MKSVGMTLAKVQEQGLKEEQDRIMLTRHEIR